MGIDSTYILKLLLRIPLIVICKVVLCILS